MKTLKKLPKFKNEANEREFWLFAQKLEEITYDFVVQTAQKAS